MSPVCLPKLKPSTGKGLPSQPNGAPVTTLKSETFNMSDFGIEPVNSIFDREKHGILDGVTMPNAASNVLSKRSSGFTQTAGGGSIAYGNGIAVWLAASTSAGACSYDNGLTWTNIFLPAASNGSVHFAGGRFYSINIVTVYTSTDGLNWTSFALGTNGTSNPGNITYGNGVYIAGITIAAGNYWHSTDGLTWSQKTHGQAARAHNFASFGNNMFTMMTTVSSTYVPYLTSSDGINWTNRTMPNTAAMTVYGMMFGGTNNVFVVGTNTVNYYWSTDGVSWSAQGVGGTQQALQSHKDGMLSYYHGSGYKHQSSTGTGFSTMSGFTGAVGCAYVGGGAWLGTNGGVTNEYNMWFSNINGLSRWVRIDGIDGQIVCLG